MTTFFLIIAAMSVFCVGIRILMSDGMLLSFMRQPTINKIKDIKREYEDSCDNARKICNEALGINCEYSNISNDNKHSILSKQKAIRDNELDRLEKQLNNDLDKYYWLNPLVLCVYCFASFWGTIAFCLIHLCVLNTSPSYPIIGAWILSTVCCTVLNVLLDSLMLKLNIYE